MPTSFEHDVFVAYHPKDDSCARQLAERLKRDGLRVSFEGNQIETKGVLSRKSKDTLNKSRVLVLCISQYIKANDWINLEGETFRFREPTYKEGRFIPVLLEDGEVPESLAKFAYIDWRKQSKQEYLRLLAAARPPADSELDVDDSTDGVSCKVLEILMQSPTCITISGNGLYAFSGNTYGRIRRWDLRTGRSDTEFGDVSAPIDALSSSFRGDIVISGRYDGALSIWNLNDLSLSVTYKLHSGYIRASAITPDGKIAVTGSADKSVCVWDVQKAQLISRYEAHAGQVNCVDVSADGKRVVSGGQDNFLQLWQEGVKGAPFQLYGHHGEIVAVAITSNGKKAVSAGVDKTLRVWDVEARKLVSTIEGHTAAIKSLAVSSTGDIAVSCSDNNAINVWSLQTFEQIGVLEGHTNRLVALGIADDGNNIVSISQEGEVRLWRLPVCGQNDHISAKTTLYTNAKVLLVGDSGAGKTGLAYRLTQDVFKETASTDAAWATQLKLPNTSSKKGTEREIWLWDFAGQADYRLIHQLFMDEAALAILVFNPQSENPFEGLSQWDRDLRSAARRIFSKILVAGRCDRGGLMISRKSIEEFQKERNYIEYIETSALLGTGCDKLRSSIVRNIPWNDIPWTASPRVFKLLKDEIVKLKDEGTVLMRLSELKQQLDLRIPGESFTIEQLRAVVGLLAGPGVVWQLEFGDFVLLQPERVNAYAAAVIRSVRSHTEEIGCIAEEDVLAGKLNYQDLKRLPHEEEQIVLRTMHQTFVDHGLCVRTHTDKGAILTFPSYFKRERPELEMHPFVLVTYEFDGPADEIYATLVVRLHHTDSFQPDRLWRFAADFKTDSGKRLGLKLTKKPEGKTELKVYFEEKISEDTQVIFIRYVHEHLMSKAHNVVRHRNYICQNEKCKTPIQNALAIERRLAAGFGDIICGVCEKRVTLKDLIEEKFASDEFRQKAQAMEVIATNAIDNESKELILVGHTYAIAGEAGQIYRQYTNSDHGIDGEIEFKDHSGAASGKRLYLQLKSGDSYLVRRKRDGRLVFAIKKTRHLDYWVEQAYPVMLVIRGGNGNVLWMNITEYLKTNKREQKSTRQIVFEGEPFTALNLRRLRDSILR